MSPESQKRSIGPIKDAALGRPAKGREQNEGGKGIDTGLAARVKDRRPGAISKCDEKKS